MDFLVKFVIAQLLLILLYEDVTTCSNSLLTPKVIELSGSGEIRTIDSPGWPDEYDKYELCYWRVQAPPGHKIGWKFDPDYQMQPDFRCNRDYVSLYDSYSTSRLIGKYCGLWEPSPAMTNGRYLLIKFKTDGSLQYRGFRIAVKLDSIPSTVPAYYDSQGISMRVVGVLVLLVFVIVIGACICACCCCCCKAQQGRRGLVIGNNNTSSSTATSTTTGATTVSHRVAPPHQSAYPQNNYNLQQYGSNFSAPAQPPYPVNPAYPPTDPYAPPSYATPSAPPPSYNSLFDK